MSHLLVAWPVAGMMIRISVWTDLMAILGVPLNAM